MDEIDSIPEDDFLPATRAHTHTRGGLRDVVEMSNVSFLVAQAQIITTVIFAYTSAAMKISPEFAGN
jgi:hypothetical protein